MDEPKVSLVIVSRDRPAGLHRLLCSLQFQCYRNFEVIIVTNSEITVSKQVCVVPFDDANISAARNVGIQHSQGDLVAFCDDDAIPEPTWLEELVAPFSNKAVGIAGGFVRGRNGIDFQWKAQQVNQFGFDKPLDIEDEHKAQIFGQQDEWSPKVQGTNCIFRKSLLEELGGFDENFKFYLDETDISYRASKQGWLTAIVPNAEVQHGFLESARRTAMRVPKSLFAEGSSKAYFCKKHGNGASTLQEYDQFKSMQRKRLLQMMVSGLIGPWEVELLLSTLEKGLIAGQKLNLNKPVVSKNKQRDFITYTQGDGINCSGEVIAGSVLSRKTLEKAAIKASSAGKIVTLFCWSFTTLFHRRYFDEMGFWRQTGGLFGKSERDALYFQYATVLSRSKLELKWLKKLRKTDKLSVYRFNKVLTVTK